MAQLKSISKKLLLVIVTISLVLTFIATPSAEAKLTLGEGEFYYSGTTKGTYKASTSIFSWLLANIGDIADWLIGIMTMGFRMVFVGWTALIEKILTWTLEGTTGVNTDGENVSSTDLSSVSDSSNNITVQAIVYNQVPAFDINFFSLEYDKSYSGTGKKLTCSKCDKPVKECCGENATSCSSCEKECKGNCDDCQRYIAANSVTGDPIIVQIKKVVATWYYVMRLLSAAVLLIILIGIGIKMGLSTIASEKAVYKSMLIDWVAGAIIVFAIHYIMIFVIFINSALINTVKESANSINKVQMMQMAEKSDSNIEYTDDELEINIYEAVRTRAYDPKLMNGMSGMIMYMTLVYFAIRYSIVYLKRLLTLIVLTLMAPAVGVSYAIQKVFSGKAQSLTNWGTEYTMNVLIQTVHAIIYSVFISTALILSLQNVAGMILALILMNYALKAEKTFRTIFKMGAGGSLLDHTAGAGDAEKMKETFNSAKGLAMGAKPALKALSNTPYAKALKGAAKIGIAGGILTASKIASNRSKSETTEGGDDSSGSDTGNVPMSPTPIADSYAGAYAEAVSSGGETNEAFGGVKTDNTKALINAGSDKLLAEVQSAAAAVDAERVGGKEPSPESTERLNKALANYSKYKGLEANFSTGDIVKGHAQKLIDVKNNYLLEYNDKGNISFSSMYNQIFGTKHRDTKTGKMVSDKNGLYSRLSAENLLGFTPEDKKIFKDEVIKPILAGAGGIASVFVGMGTMVAHPKMGLAMVAGGSAAARGALKKPISAGDYKGRYSFARFSAPTVANIQKETLKRSQAEWDRAVVSNLKNTHPEMYEDLVRSTDTGAMRAENFVQDLANFDKAAISAGLLSIGMLPVVGIPAAMAVAGVAGAGQRRFMAKTGFSSRMDKISAHSAKQLHQQQLNFIEDSYKVQAASRTAEYEARYDVLYTKMEADEYAAVGLVYDADKKDWISIEEKVANGYNQSMQQYYIDRGMKIDLDNGTIISKDQSGNEVARKIEVARDEFSYPSTENTGRRRVSNKDFNSIRIEIEKSVEILLEQNPNADLADEKTLAQLDTILAGGLANRNVIKQGQSAEILFEAGKDGMRDVLTRQLDYQRAKKESADIALEGMDSSTRKVVETMVSEMRHNGVTASNVSVNHIVNKIEKSGSKEADASRDGSRTVSEVDKVRITQFVEAMTSEGAITVKAPESSEITRRKVIANKRAKEKRATLDQYISELSTDSDTLLTLAKAMHDGVDAKVEVSKYSTEEQRKARKKKLEEIGKLGFKTTDGSDPEQEQAAIKENQAAIEQAKKTNDEKVVIDISHHDTGEILELLLMRKEIEHINELAAEELKIKDGIPGYTSATKNESSAKVNHYKAQLEYEQEKYQREINGQFDHENDLKMQMLEQKIEAARQLLDIAIEEKAAKGPIVSVEAFIEDIARTHGGEVGHNMRKAFERNRGTIGQKIGVLSDQAERKQKQQQRIQEDAERTAKKEQEKTAERTRKQNDTTRQSHKTISDIRNSNNNNNG